MNSAFPYEGSSAVGSESTSAIIRSTGSAYIGINLVNSAHSSGIALNLAANDAVAVNGTPCLKSRPEDGVRLLAQQVLTGTTSAGTSI